ncbi:hypothetical protein P7K49_011856 [Saguinus oedipus]|uniref:Uncharacterized protein n=1 Tax=Saguinus oedipus TaxID=9490 RepID=A0ABQ9VRV6_SAGOE|nr:hypothetical protein P7K49_011856 [Saguinus oedipus]
MAGGGAGRARGTRKAEDAESGGSSSSFLGIVRPRAGLHPERFRPRDPGSARRSAPRSTPRRGEQRPNPSLHPAPQPQSQRRGHRPLRASEEHRRERPQAAISDEGKEADDSLKACSSEGRVTGSLRPCFDCFQGSSFCLTFLGGPA